VLSPTAVCVDATAVAHPSRMVGTGRPEATFAWLQLGTWNASFQRMTQLALTTGLENRPAVVSAASAARARLHVSGQELELRLKDYIEGQGWTLGTLLASTLLAILVGVSRTRNLGEVMFVNRRGSLPIDAQSAVRVASLGTAQ